MDNRYSFKLILLFFVSKSYASSCCGGGGSSHKLIIADNKRELAFSQSFKDNLGETNKDGAASFNPRKIKDQSFTQTIEYKELITDRSQIGFSFFYQEKNLYKTGVTAKKSGPGDLSFSYNYEMLPERFYSAYMPRVFTGVRLNYPFGKNLYNSKEPLKVDVIGSGQKTIGATIVAVKNGWIGSLLPTFVPKNSATPHYWINTLGISKSTVFDAITLGGGANWNYTSNKRRLANKIQNWDAIVFGNYQIFNQYNLGLNYTDNTLIGKSVNSPLSREIMFTLSYFETL